MNSPSEIANNYVAIGKAKANLSIGKMLLLAIMAGIFIGVGGIASTTASVSVSSPSLAKFVAACVFPGGLTMVLLAGSELFTGNCLLVIPWLQKEISLGKMLKNWFFVYIGNLIGGLLLAAGVVFSHTPNLFDSKLAVSILSTASAKCSLSFSDALIKGILCNFLVCIAVWLAFAAKDVAGKVIGLFFPIMMFVVCGFEHSVANMYYIGAGLMAKTLPSYAQAAADAGVNLDSLTLGNFCMNLLPVTIGNIIGGGICVGMVYWLLYVRKSK